MNDEPIFEVIKVQRKGDFWEIGGSGVSHAYEKATAVAITPQARK